MTGRERVAAALEWRAPDRVPVQVHPSPGGLYEHGRKLLDLLHACPSDFDDLSGLSLPAPPRKDFDPDGSYHRVETDAWGVTWEYRIYGIWGHPRNEPLADLARLADYVPPEPPPLRGPAFEAARREVDRHRERHYCVRAGGMIWEQMHFLRPYGECLVDIMDDTPAINRIADLITDYLEGCIRHHLATGADAVLFADDFGTQQAPIFPPAVWRRFFKPRYRKLCDLIRAEGRRVFFHSCGRIDPLFEDLAELGVSAVWPQLPLYDPAELAHRCRDLGLAVLLHPDRGELMQSGTPDDVRAYIPRLLDAFGTAGGGSWLYIEIDPGFRWENVEALLECVVGLRPNG